MSFHTYCTDCNRYFQNREALRQHRQDSNRHAFTFLPTKTTTPIRPYAQTTALGSGMAFTGFGGSPASSVTQIARGTAGDDPSKDLISSLKGLYFSGEYSDLVISCGGREYHVHRAIVCMQSEFFSAACRGSFKAKGKIDLLDNDSQLVYIIVHYLYHFDYDVRLQHERSGFDRLEMDKYETNVNELAADALLTHAKIYALAEKYLIHRLKALALQQFKAAATHSKWLDEEKVRDVVKELRALTYDMVICMR
ncbi:hypothetical protein QBC32DRAFT_357015 [Pseudoneurospora amorphoporcata]|uniref:BTB domain-containing protein n=1 Tax=Pseudoneurospora amorphoporcata TaxID=241081 RepID=A0AAN6NK85_9PEZI|nr:hypothetical protein QBC32DRAFT_357015 [Pseudoneurospora amorphoporcata]